MNDRDDTIAKIRNALTTEASAVRLSNRLFAPGGLFSKLFATPEEKIVVVDSPLFDEAQKRLSELQRQESATLAKGSQPHPIATIGTAQLEQLHPSTADV